MSDKGDDQATGEWTLVGRLWAGLYILAWISPVILGVIVAIIGHWLLGVAVAIGLYILAFESIALFGRSSNDR
jgi:hypothetical protein